MSGNTMKALLLRKHGGLDDLDVVSDHPVPRAAEGHVVIRVRAAFASVTADRQVRVERTVGSDDRAAAVVEGTAACRAGRCAAAA